MKLKIKKYFPKKLFYRFLLIIILPLFIVQLISTYIFYQNHIQNVVKRISKDTIQKISFIEKNYRNNDNYKGMNLDVSFVKKGQINKKDIIKNTNKYLFFNQEQFFIETLLGIIKEPIAISTRNDRYIISIQKKDGILNISVNKKELIVKTAKIFTIWNVILSCLTLSIAIIFMKNQLKPIKLLKKHIKTFSLTQTISKFKPTGAKEIRELSISFVEMEKRLKKFVEQRTLMLAGISHDLRTPLTRMRLEVEMMEGASKKYLTKDIDYMESIVNQYLNFTKNIKSEEKTLIDVYDYINEFTSEYKKINKNLKFKTKNIDKNEMVLIQRTAFKRVLHNITDNAFKFGDRVTITLSKSDSGKKINIDIDDNGKGIKKEELERLTEPFYKIDESRNIETGGVGLGLAISKDIVLMNNGTLSFNDSKTLGGLNVFISLDIIFDKFI